MSASVATWEGAEPAPALLLVDLFCGSSSFELGSALGRVRVDPVEVSVDVGDWITKFNTPINRKATIIRGFHVCQFDSDSFSKLNREGGNLLMSEDMVVWDVESMNANG
jgi:hypothetical protein